MEGRELWGEGQWALLRKLVEERKPATIAVDISHTHAFSDGLTAGEREKLESALGPWTAKLVRAENLPLEYIAVRVPEMLPTYRQMMQIVHALIGRAFSSEVITPGKTTTEDVVWWLRQQVNDQGLGEWFPPSVSVQRPGQNARDFTATADRSSVVIERGDHLWTDFGIRAMGLSTDTQHVGYVLRPGETDAPAGLQKALANSNRLQDIVMERMKPGRTGNEVLAESLAAAKAEGILGTIYSHPIGDHGHGAGPLIGLWDRQEGVPGRGDVLFLPVHLVLHRAAGHDQRSRMEQHGPPLRPGGRRGHGRGRPHVVGARAADEVSPRAVSVAQGSPLLSVSVTSWVTVVPEDTWTRIRPL